MIGNRMRQARLASGFTQDEVVDRLFTRGRRITKGGISKYERNLSTPGAGFLSDLGKVLGVKSSYFLSDPSCSVSWIAYRKRAKPGKRRQDLIEAQAFTVVESQLWLMSIMKIDSAADFPTPMIVRSFDDAELAAGALRHAWQLSDLPIDRITLTMEDRGCIVVGLSLESNGFDGLSGWVNAGIPVTVTNTAIPDDRRRYNLAHELGHIFMDCSEVSGKQEEQFAHRFAAAFLVPAFVARKELGTGRRSLNVDELGMLKQKYGLSMQAWIRRARDLNIITQNHYNSLFIEFSRRGWRKNEPYKLTGEEAPAKFRQLTQRALGEGIISLKKAEAIFPGSTAGTSMPHGKTKSLTASELRRLPKSERSKILAEAAAKAEKFYSEDNSLTDFHISGEGSADD